MRNDLGESVGGAVTLGGFKPMLVRITHTLMKSWDVEDDVVDWRSVQWVG